MESVVRAGSVGAASSFARQPPQQPIAGRVWQKYTLNISRLFNVLKRQRMPPQI
jgi:hypothetical protein